MIDISSLLLTILIFLPLVVAVMLMIGATSAEDTRNIAFFTSILVLIIVAQLYVGFESVGDMQFVTNVPWIEHFGINYNIGLDGFSLSILVLIAVLIPCAYMMLWHGRTKGYWISMLLIQVGVTGALLSLDLILFYFFWEIMLLPIFLIIGMYGKGDKIKSTLKVTIYTMAGSLLMFVAIIYLGVAHYNEFGVWSFSLIDLQLVTIDKNIKIVLFFAFVTAFAIKIPLFPFHTWLLTTYSTAPTGGVFLLSSVMAKLGVYAIIRFMIPLFPEVYKDFSIFFVFIGLFSMIYFGIAALRRDDLRHIMAYSSASHLGLIAAGFFSLNVYGLAGAIYLIMAHAITTGGLFLLIGIMEYKLGTRSIKKLGGIAKAAPIFTIFFAILLFGNIGVPGTNGFVAELLIIMGIFDFNQTLGFIASISVLVAASFMLWMFQRAILQDKEDNSNSVFIKNIADLYPRQIFGLLPLVTLVIIMGIFPGVFIDKFEPTITYFLKDILHLGASIK